MEIEERASREAETTSRNEDANEIVIETAARSLRIHNHFAEHLAVLKIFMGRADLP